MVWRHRQILAPDERLDWLRLIRSEKVGPVTFFHLIRHYGSAKAALDALPALARRGGKRGIKLYPKAEAEREIAALETLGARLVAHGEPDYPRALGAIDDAPPLLAVMGETALTERPAVAVVGARNASANGRRLATQLAEGLGAAGFTVVSGLARGIDTAAHRGALETGTVAVLAGGIDVPYPPENEALTREIAARGLLVAENPPGVEPVARHFPRRNRLISGLSLGVVVVEAAPRSGSLITARMALEQGREVFAMPGSPLDPRARGANDLIRNGATLTESAEDVIRVLEAQVSASEAPPETPELLENKDLQPSTSDGVDAHDAVLELLSPSPIGVDELIRQCQLSAASVAVALFELELAGRIERHPGGQVSLTIT